IEKVVEQEAGPRHQHARAERTAEALGEANHVALPIRDREGRGVMLLAWSCAGERQPLLGRSLDRSAVADAGSQLLNARIRQKMGQRSWGWKIVGDAFAGRQADGAPDGVEVLNAVALKAGQVNAVEDAQCQ